MAEDRNFTLKIITPERVFYEGPVSMVEFNTTEGAIGIYKGHIPMTVMIKPGILTITTDEGKREAALHAGFVEILQTQVTVLAEVVEWPEEIDANRAKAALEGQRNASGAMNRIRIWQGRKLRWTEPWHVLTF